VGARRYVIKFSGMDITLGLAAAKANQGCVHAGVAGLGRVGSAGQRAGRALCACVCARARARAWAWACACVRRFLIVGPVVGFLGVALTGSATTSNVLFGSLQTVAADRLGYNPVQLAASNVAGGILGHIISTASMVVTGDSGKNIVHVYKAVAGYAIVLIAVYAVWNLAIALAFPGFIPTAPYLS
jgi:L-lactate permease